MLFAFRSLRLVAIPVPLDHRAQNRRHENRPRKPLVDHGCHFGCVVTQRGRAELGEPDLLERHVGEIEHLSASRLIFSIHPVFEILVWSVRNALLGLVQEVHPLAKDYCPRGTHFGTGRLLVLLQALVEAELALDDLGIPFVPLELRHVEGAGHLTVAAPDTERTVPRDSTPRVLLQGAEWAAGYAGGIQAVHALPFDKAELCSTRLFVELDDVLSLRVEIRRDVPETRGERSVEWHAGGCVGRQAIRLATGCHTGPAAGADGVVVEHGHGIRRGDWVCRVLLRDRGFDQTSGNGAPGADYPHQELTAVDRNAHDEAFGPVPVPAPPSGVSGAAGGAEPGTVSSSPTVENLREAT